MHMTMIDGTTPPVERTARRWVTPMIVLGLLVLTALVIGLGLAASPVSAASGGCGG